VATFVGSACSAAAQPAPDAPAPALSAGGGWSVAWTATLPGPAQTQGATDARGMYVPLRSGSVVALSLESGQVLWDAQAPAAVPPAADGERVFVAGPDVVDAISTRSGERLWRTPLAARPAVGLALSGATLLIGLASGDLQALDTTSGATRWQAALGAPLSVPPVAEGARVVVGLADGAVVALEVADGRIAWRAAVPEAVSALGAAGDRVFAGSLDNFLYALQADNGRLLWRWRTGGDVIGVPTTDAARVYFVSLDNVLRALDRGHGAQRWKAALPTRPLGGPALLGDELLVSLVSTEVGIVNARDGKAKKPVPVEAEPAASLLVVPGPPSPSPGPSFLLVTRDGRVRRFTRGAAAVPAASAPLATTPPAATPVPR